MLCGGDEGVKAAFASPAHGLNDTFFAKRLAVEENAAN